ncbi:MAG: helix-turn-helix domain-containing protein, partial [Rhodothermales bacterium]
RNRGLVVTKRRLLREAWRIDDDLISYTINPDVAIAQVDRYVQAIRRKIEANPTKPKHIETVYGLGYRFRE